MSIVKAKPFPLKQKEVRNVDDVQESVDTSDEEMESSGDELSEQNSLTNEDDDSESQEDISDEDDDRLSIDDNVDGEGWMDVDADESNTDELSSSDDEPPADNGLAVTADRNKVDCDDVQSNGNTGWADVMAKILKSAKPKGKKSVVLAKAKKLSQMSVAEKSEDLKGNLDFEIEGEIKEEDDVKPKVEELNLKPSTSEKISKLRQRQRLAEGRVKPSILQRERERALSKIATKGVVQLFNAVRQQQKDINSKLKEAKGSFRKEEKILKSLDKRTFLDTLMGNATSERVENLVRTKEEPDVKEEYHDKPATWSVLRDNYLTSSNLKDWDKCGEIKIEEDDDDDDGEVDLN